MSARTLTISTQEFAGLLRGASTFHLVDVRTQQEQQAEYIPGAALHPVQEMDAAAVSQQVPSSDTPIVLLCQSGKRAVMAAEKLADHCSNPLWIVEGGLNACKAAALPFVKKGHGVSMERQVRIAAGALVLFGCLLGAAVQPAMYGLAVLIGAGLLYSGVSDTCGMARVLALMPWNRAH